MQISVLQKPLFESLVMRKQVFADVAALLFEGLVLKWLVGEHPNKDHWCRTPKITESLLRKKIMQQTRKWNLESLQIHYHVFTARGINCFCYLCFCKIRLFVILKQCCDILHKLVRLNLCISMRHVGAILFICSIMYL